jgi:hypothetical protein
MLPNIVAGRTIAITDVKIPSILIAAINLPGFGISEGFITI